MYVFICVCEFICTIHYLYTIYIICTQKGRKMDAARSDYLEMKNEYESILILNNKDIEDNPKSTKYIKQLQELKSMMNVAEV